MPIKAQYHACSSITDVAKTRVVHVLWRSDGIHSLCWIGGKVCPRIQENGRDLLLAAVIMSIVNHTIRNCAAEW